jgi:mono/diheme cytochrome c family protein
MTHLLLFTRILLLITTILSGLTAGYAYAGMGHGMMRHGGDHITEKSVQEKTADAYRSNGERIYYTGISEKSGRIPFAGGPMWLEMHGGSCVSCHGTSGQGGFPVMMGTKIPPDIRYETLTEEEHLHGEGKDTHRRYSDELIKRAVRNGLDADGKTLDLMMPRYKITEEDLNELINYLKTLK